MNNMNNNFNGNQGQSNGQPGGSGSQGNWQNQGNWQSQGNQGDWQSQGNWESQNNWQSQSGWQNQNNWQGQESYNSGPAWQGGPWQKPKGKKGVKIFAIAIVAVVIVGIILAKLFGGGTGVHHDYIANLYIDGTIVDGTSNDGYSQEWLTDTIKDLTEDKHNKGIMLRLNTPGGSVNATADVYALLEKYKKETGRPVYAYMDQVAASGGYYISMAADQIYANPECWTGSIGVIIGNFYDVSELLNKLGIKVSTIVSGPNKGMGNPTQPMTKEQKEIYQGIVDDAYGRFLDVVEKGRHMDRETLIPIADGRIYTAKQAKENGLIDEVSNEETAQASMQKKCKLTNCDFEEFKYEPKPSLLDNPFGFKALANIFPKNQYETVLNFVEENQQVGIQYLAPVKK